MEVRVYGAHGVSSMARQGADARAGPDVRNTKKYDRKIRELKSALLGGYTHDELTGRPNPRSARRHIYLFPVCSSCRHVSLCKYSILPLSAPSHLSSFFVK